MEDKRGGRAKFLLIRFICLLGVGSVIKGREVKQNSEETGSAAFRSRAIILQV
jgi:hypothetical protein